MRPVSPSYIVLTAGLLEPGLHQGLAQGVLALPAEGGTVDQAALERADLTTDHLQNVGHGHTRRYGVGVDDQVWNYTVRGERHVGGGDQQSDHALLPVPGGELVAQFRYPLVPDLDLDQAGAVLRLGQHDAVHPAGLSGAAGDGRLTPLLDREEVSVLLLHETGRRGLSDQDITAGDRGLRRDQPVLADRLV